MTITGNVKLWSSLSRSTEVCSIYNEMKEKFKIFAPFSRSRYRSSKGTRTTVYNDLTTVTPLNLRSSTTRSNRLHRSKTDFSQIQKMDSLSNNDILPQPSQQEELNMTPINSRKNQLPNMTSQVRDRAHTAVSRRLTGIHICFYFLLSLNRFKANYQYSFSYFSI